MKMRPLAVIGNVNVDLIIGPVGSWPQQGTEVMVGDLPPGRPLVITRV